MEITLNKNGFHRRLQLWCFGKNCPLYFSFCPYFWLTIFCGIFTFLLPIFPAIKILKYAGIGLLWLMDKAANGFEKWVCEPLLKTKAFQMNDNPDELLMSAWNYSDGWDTDYEFWRYQFFDMGKLHKNSDARRKKFEVWKQNTPNWQQILGEVKEKRRAFFLEQAAERERLRKQIAEEEAAKQERQERNRKRRQAAFTWIAKYTKWIAFVFAAALISFVAYWAYQLGVYMYDHFYYDKFVAAMKFIGIVILILAIVVGIGVLLYKIITSIKCKAACYLCECEFKWLKKLSVYVGNFFVGVGKVLAFLWNGIILFKKEYCPGINWENNK